MTPESIQIHEDWNPNDEPLEADIAMLTFAKSGIQESMFIQPICLWNDEEEGFPLGNAAITGWGLSQSEKKIEPTPMYFKVSFHGNKDCFSILDELKQSSNQRTICAGAGSGICFGYTGGSLVVKVESTFYFRGISSSGLWNDLGGCDVDNYQVYADGLKHFLWIKNKMKKAVCRKAPDRRLDLGTTWLACAVINQTIDKEGFTIDRYLDEDVERLYVGSNTKMIFLPNNVAESFPNLFSYNARFGTLKHITEKYFSNLTKLSSLYLFENQIESIASDAFKDLTKLKELKLGSNKIKIVDPKWFQSLKKLDYLILDHNEIENLDENTFDNLININHLALNSNKLTSIPAELFDKNLRLGEINFSNNRIKKINSDMFDNLPRLYKIYLYDNECVHIEYSRKSDFQLIKKQLKENCENVLRKQLSP